MPSSSTPARASANKLSTPTQGLKLSKPPSVKSENPVGSKSLAQATPLRSALRNATNSNFPGGVSRKVSGKSSVKCENAASPKLKPVFVSPHSALRDSTNVKAASGKYASGTTSKTAAIADVKPTAFKSTSVGPTGIAPLGLKSVKTKPARFKPVARKSTSSPTCAPLTEIASAKFDKFDGLLKLVQLVEATTKLDVFDYLFSLSSPCDRKARVRIPTARMLTVSGREEDVDKPEVVECCALDVDAVKYEDDVCSARACAKSANNDIKEDEDDGDSLVLDIGAIPLAEETLLNVSLDIPDDDEGDAAQTSQPIVEELLLDVELDIPEDNDKYGYAIVATKPASASARSLLDMILDTPEDEDGEYDPLQLLFDHSCGKFLDAANAHTKAKSLSYEPVLSLKEQTASPRDDKFYAQPATFKMRDDDVRTEVPMVNLVDSEGCVVDTMKPLVRSFYVAPDVMRGKLPDKLESSAKRYWPNGVLDAENARPVPQAASYAMSLKEQTASRCDNAFLGQAAFLEPRDDDVRMDVPQINIVNTAGRVVDNLKPLAMFFYVAPDAKPVPKPVTVPSREQVRAWFAERKEDEAHVAALLALLTDRPKKPITTLIKDKDCPPFPYGRGWTREAIELNELALHQRVRFPELLPPPGERKAKVTT